MAPFLTPQTEEFVYPSFDGQRRAENMAHGNWIFFFKYHLDAIFEDDPNVLVAIDLLWYPLRENISVRIAPDALVVFGRPKEPLRQCYVQCREGDRPLTVAMEIRPACYTDEVMEEKFAFYDRYGVEEYYVYYPARASFHMWLRQDGSLKPVAPTQPPLTERNDWISPRMGIRFSMFEGKLSVFRPDGTCCMDLREIASRSSRYEEQAEANALREEAERQRAESEKARIEAEAIKDLALRRIIELQTRIDHLLAQIKPDSIGEPCRE